MAETEILGLDVINDMLDGMELKTQTAVRRSLAVLGRQARDEVKAATPVDTGNLKRSIALKGTKPNRDGRVSYAVIARQDGSRTGLGFHYHLVEYGTVKMRARRFAAPIRQRYTGSGGAVRLQNALQTVINREILKRAAGQ